jgi:protein-disulfide isomerase
MKPFVSRAILRAGLVLALLPAVVCAQQPMDEQIAALRKEIEALREVQVATQKDVQEIRAMLERALTPPGAGAVATDAQVSVAGAPVRGSAEAPLTMVEFSDYHCPFCARYAKEVFPQIQRDFVDTGRLRYVFVNFPIDQLHPRAARVHEAAACAADQGRFWEMHERLFANVSATQDPADLPGHAQAVGLDVTAFQACLDQGRHAETVRRQVADAAQLGIRGTPTFVVGTLASDGHVRAQQVISGAQPYQVFKEIIEGLLPDGR